MRALGAVRTLVVCPAIVRDDWVTRVNEWWDAGPWPTAVVMGRGSQSGSKNALASRDLSYLYPIQVVSYELLKHVEATGWDCIIADEAHYLQSARSQASKHVLALRRANPSAHFLELSATLMPDNPKQVWNLLHILQPGKWGRASKSGDPDYRFQQRYCLGTPNEYASSGMSYSGANPETAPELVERMSAFTSRLTRYDLREYLPRCDVSPLYIDRTDRREDWKIAQEYLQSATMGSTHVGLFTYHREQAQALAMELQDKFDIPIIQVSGEEPVAQRKRLLRMVQEMPKAVLVATMKSVGVGISLTWIKEFLSVEWYTSPGTMLQFLGRFERLDSSIPSRGQFLVRRGTEQENQAFKLVKKIEAINHFGKEGAATAQLRTLFDTEMTEDQFQAELDALVAGYVDTSLTDDDTDESF